MKRLLFILTLFTLTAIAGNAQKPKPADSSAPKKTVAQNVNPVAEISADEWDNLVKSLDAEDWDKSALLAAAYIKKLKTDNEKKQLARLRYFYLYSLAGKAAQKKMPYPELDRFSQVFIGQEFLMPSREVLADCAGKVNYVCPVKADDNSLRVTATDKSAVIHAFEYVKLPEKFDVAANSGKEVFLSGKLKKMEINSYKTAAKIMRLEFENGAVELVAKK